MHNRIVVEVRDQYGRATIYPVCETAKKFAQIADTRTITQRALRVIQSLGYSVTVRPHAGFDSPAAHRVTAALDVSTSAARLAATLR